MKIDWDISEKSFAQKCARKKKTKIHVWSSVCYEIAKVRLKIEEKGGVQTIY